MTKKSHSHTCSAQSFLAQPYIGGPTRHSGKPGFTSTPYFPYKLLDGSMYYHLLICPILSHPPSLRHYIGILRQEHLLTALQSHLDHLSSVHNFRPIEFQPQCKDGGVFVRFSYTPSNTPEDEHLSKIENSLREESEKHGALPSWLGFGRGTIWLVKGSPWNEVIAYFTPVLTKWHNSLEGHEPLCISSPQAYIRRPRRFRATTLRIVSCAFCLLFSQLKRSDISEQPYGRIIDLTMPSTVAAGAPRSATVTYQRIYSATIARNVIHGLDLFSPSSSTSLVKTRLRAGYQRPIQVHVIRDWMSNHPKIMLPLLLFFFGTVTYTVSMSILFIIYNSNDRLDF